MSNLLPSPDMHDLSFLELIGPSLGLTVDSRSDTIIEIHVFVSTSCGTESSLLTFKQDELPTTLDLVRRLQTIPQFHGVYAKFTLERMHIYAGIATLRNCLYYYPGLGHDTWNEEGWGPKDRKQ